MGKREGPRLRKQQFNKIAAGEQADPTAARRGAGSRKCPRRPQELARPQPRRRLLDTCLAAPGVWFTLQAPPTRTLREGEGREEPRPWTRSLRAPPPAVPDINCGSLSPLLGGGEDDTRPATFPLLGSRRSGSRPLPGAARCRLDFSPAAAAAAAEGGPVPAPALLLRPSPQRVQATAR